MLVCDECGLNIEIMGTHLPGCSHYDEKQHDKAVEDALDKELEGVEAWNAVMEAASDRGTVMAQSMIKAFMIDSGVNPPETFDQATIDVFKIAAWAGVLAAIQIFSEQEFIDRQAIVNFTRGALDFE